MIAETPTSHQHWIYDQIFNVSADATGPISLEQFVTFLPLVLSSKKTSSLPDEIMSVYVSDLFRRLDLQKQEWEKYAYCDLNKNYTRNLVATDGETYSLILMCWSPGRESPIHDHPCNGCWVRVFEGSIHEVRYNQESSTGNFICSSDSMFNEGEISYMHDSMGYHKIGNPSPSSPAVSLHLYCPPFDKCKIWLDPSVSTKPSNVSICFYSKYGKKI